MKFLKKHRIFLIRTVNLVLVALMLYQCQHVLQARAAADEKAYEEYAAEQARIDAEYEAALAEIEPDKAEEAGSALKDGVYEGTADGYGGPITVSVTITDGQITAVEVTDHSKEDPSYYSMAETVAEKIVQTQSLEVDTVSGATFSSAGIRNAAILAVQKAM